MSTEPSLALPTGPGLADLAFRPQRYDVIVVGGGAAGLMCAIEAGKRGRRVAVLEHSAAVGRKILISGGGRCNFTNLHATPEDFISDNKGFCVSALSRYTPEDFIALVRRYDIPYHEKKLGQLFCDRSARDIVGLLLRECEDARVTILLSCPVASLRHEGLFYAETDRGVLAADSLVIATGGLSIPKLGATGFAYSAARDFGLKVVPTRPGLVPLTLAPSDLARYQPLAGVSVRATVRCGGVAFAENILFTHRGLSGPAVLQASSYWRDGEPVEVDLAPEVDVGAFLRECQARRPKSELQTALAELLPRRFAEALCEHLLPNRPLARLSAPDLNAAAQLLKHWRIFPSGTEGYRTAEVTVGGVDTRDLSSKTMGTVKVPGLYFIGEAVDVTGPLGGYNFQWAWASGYCAGQYV